MSSSLACLSTCQYHKCLHGRGGWWGATTGLYWAHLCSRYHKALDNITSQLCGDYSQWLLLTASKTNWRQSEHLWTSWYPYTHALFVMNGGQICVLRCLSYKTSFGKPIYYIDDKAIKWGTKWYKTVVDQYKLKSLNQADYMNSKTPLFANIG